MQADKHKNKKPNNKFFSCVATYNIIYNNNNNNCPYNHNNNNSNSLLTVNRN